MQAPGAGSLRFEDRSGIWVCVFSICLHLHGKSSHPVGKRLDLRCVPAGGEPRFVDFVAQFCMLILIAKSF